MSLVSTFEAPGGDVALSFADGNPDLSLDSIYVELGGQSFIREVVISPRIALRLNGDGPRLRDDQSQARLDGLVVAGPGKVLASHRSQGNYRLTVSAPGTYMISLSLRSSTSRARDQSKSK